MTTPLLFGSACSGIGGMDSGLEDAGMRCAWQIEIDPRCVSVLRYHWPEVPKHRDLREVNPVDLAPVHVIAGGTPCQDLSVAGARAGLDGERSGLFHDFVRLADSQPSAWVLWENVDGALSSPAGSKGEDFAIVLRELTGFYPSVPVGGWRSAGFCVGPERWAVWRVLDSQFFGVAQRRNRLFVVAGSGARPCPEVLLEPDCVSGNPSPSREAGAGVASLLAGSAGRGWRVGAEEAAGGQIVFGRNNTSGPLQTSAALAAHAGRYDFESESLVVSALTGGLGGADDNDAQGRRLVPVAFHLAQITSRENRANPQPGDPAPSLNADPRLAIAYQCQGSNVGPMGTLRAGNGGATGGVPFIANTLAGNSGRHQIEQTYLAVVAQTLTAAYAKTVDRAGSHGGGPSNVVTEAQGVRRLTPIEYERLQGYPDDWTRHGVNEKARTVELKDGPRYRGCGNGVTRPVAAWIGRRLAAALRSAEEVA